MDTPVPNFANAHVLVVGDVMLDRYWHGPTSRISPEAPVPVVRIDQIEERPGGAANVALNIASLGAKVTLIGVTGDDDAADTLSAQLEAAGIRCQFQRCKQFPTVTKLRVLSRHQQLIRLDFEQAFEGYDAAAMLGDVKNQLATTDVVVLSDYGKGTLESNAELITAAKKADKPVLVDPKGTDFSRYHGATLITPNLSEFEAVVGHCPDEHILAMSANALIEEHGLEALLVTRGEHGMSLLRRGENEFHLPAQAREVYDVTGAGDTVISVLAAALAAGEDLHHATALANIAAGIVVGKLGTAAVSAPELLRAVHDSKQTGRGVLSREQLMLAVKDARAGGERIVMTNGCFDILHAGHVAYLVQARQLGERLIVAVNDDDSVRSLKGSGRPINTLDRRMAVLSALQCVDWVVPFSDETPESLICEVLPDVLVKGGDYTPQQIAGHKCVQANGGEVQVLAFQEGVSTTGIIEQIKK